MKFLSRMLVAAVLASTLSVPALAEYRGHGHRGHSPRVDIVIGPYWDPWPYPSHYYPRRHYYPGVIVERPPVVYIERAPAVASVVAPVVAPVAAPVAPPVAAPGPQNYWYYCEASRNYYPYVKECARGWQKVLPQPPEQQ